MSVFIYYLFIVLRGHTRKLGKKEGEILKNEKSTKKAEDFHPWYMKAFNFLSYFYFIF